LGLSHGIGRRGTYKTRRQRHTCARGEHYRRVFLDPQSLAKKRQRGRGGGPKGNAKSLAYLRTNANVIPPCEQVKRGGKTQESKNEGGKEIVLLNRFEQQQKLTRGTLLDPAGRLRNGGKTGGTIPEKKGRTGAFRVVFDPKRPRKKWTTTRRLGCTPQAAGYIE